MPVPQIQSIAKKAGVSPAKAEAAWKKAKRVLVGAKLKSGKTIPDDPDKWTSEMWAYVVGVLKKMLGSKTESAKDMIDCILSGMSSSDVLDVFQADTVRTFTEGDEIVFATLDDVLIFKEDARISSIRSIASQESIDSMVYDILEGFEGSLDLLFARVICHSQIWRNL